MKKQSSKRRGASKTVRKELVARDFTKAELAAIDAIREKDIVYDDDSPDLADNDVFWANAKPFVAPKPKEHVSLRLNPDVLDWFKAQGKGWQGMLNAALEVYVDHQSRKPAKKVGTRRVTKTASTTKRAAKAR